ncbi:zinc finger A20 and AN1 domain-containing stress-associated protein 10-like [Benincasa hispida]|uniref:zinc finger A20 and AN1 domain-containing stress-associated protein 10-like n=1 Tax=Benincasa hispida TaxID=102211 RepID=UPI001900D9B0|nr:zinc finger A20 and AN1 domain-containing stress-associated protein 10-like [Benincasa hispida]
MAAFRSSKNGGDAPLCANNCGFYENPNNLNLCSVYYAAFLKETGEDSEPRESSKSQIKYEEPNSETRQFPSVSQNSETCENNPTPKTINRCKICRKKVGLLGFNCQCGGSFCGKHRYPEEHSCDVDHKAIGRKTLAKQIVECKANKLQFRV